MLEQVFIMATVKSNSFLTFVYPITLESGNFDKIVEAADAVEVADGGFRIWKPDEFPHDELLPHVADYLNPQNDQPPTARLWEMTNDALASPKGLGNKADWRLVLGKDREVPFKFDCVNLFMFRVGVGFLAFRVKPESNDLSDWLDLLHYFRFTKRAHYLTARRKTGKDTYDSFFPPIAVPTSEEQKPADNNADGQTETVASQTPEKKGTLSQIIHGLLNSIGEEKKLPNNWWDEIFIHNQMLGYAAVLVEDFPADEDFNLLYRLRNFFPGGKEIYPSPFDLSPNHPSLLEYGNRQWFTFSFDGGSFLACDAPGNEFFNATLPGHLRDAYFHLYIIALHQRFAMISLSQEVAEKWETKIEANKVRAFEQIRGKFLAFTTRGYFFAEVAQSEHHQRYYRKWQEYFELRRVYNEVRKMFEWLELIHAKRIQDAATEQAKLFEQETKEAARREKEEKQRDSQLAEEDARREKEAKERDAAFQSRLSLFGLLITLGIGIPALVTGFFGMNITEPPENFTLNLMTAIVWFFGAVVTSVSAALLIYFYMNRRQESDENRPQENEDKTQK